MSRWTAISPEKLRADAQRSFDAKVSLANLSARLTPAMAAALNASHIAKLDSIEAGLFPMTDESGEHRYTIQQGLKAACFAREDAAAGILLQGTALEYLRSIHRFMWPIVGLLTYIAFRVS